MHGLCWGVMIHNYTSADNALIHIYAYLLTRANMQSHPFVQLQEIVHVWFNVLLCVNENI